MPLGKYYCDYCDKQFQDTAAARRRHLQGAAHQRAKALWYNSLRSSSQLGFDDIQAPGKRVCNRFIRTPLSFNPKGWCQYGDSCKYYHPINTPHREGTSDVNNASSQGNYLLRGEASLPPGLPFGNHMGMAPGNLPPSLWPPREGGYPPLPFLDWG